MSNVACQSQSDEFAANFAVKFAVIAETPSRRAVRDGGYPNASTPEVPSSPSAVAACVSFSTFSPTRIGYYCSKKQDFKFNISEQFPRKRPRSRGSRRTVSLGALARASRSPSDRSICRRAKFEVAPAVGFGIVELAGARQPHVIGGRPADADHVVAMAFFQGPLRCLQRIERDDRIQMVRAVL